LKKFNHGTWENATGDTFLLVFEEKEEEKIEIARKMKAGKAPTSQLCAMRAKLVGKYIK
jgi:hypothetical protein